MISQWLGLSMGQCSKFLVEAVKLPAFHNEQNCPFIIPLLNDLLLAQETPTTYAQHDGKHDITAA